MGIHSDSRPFVCDTCGRAFRDNSTLKAHTRVHSGEKPYKCKLCDKSFTQRAGLNYHKAVHAGEKPHKCNQCDYATAKKASLFYHVRTIHKTSDNELVKPEEAMMVQCNEEGEGDCPAPTLPSPPSQQGDALFTGSHNSHEQNKYEEPLSNTLPSFNILKSYDSSSLQEAIVCEQSRRRDQGAGSEAITEDRFSPYESHSDPSLSPPLTPPIEEFQASESLGPSYSYHSANHSSSHSFTPLNYSTTPAFSQRNSDCDNNRYQSFYSQPHYHYKREAFNLMRGSHETQERLKTQATGDNFYGRDAPLP